VKKTARRKATLKKAVPARSAAKKKTPPARTTRAAATRRAPAPKPHHAAPSLDHALAQLEQRLSHVEQRFEEAKRRFEGASQARTASAGAQDRQVQKDLSTHAIDLRLLVVRRTELLWLRRLLQEGGPAAG
jgi:hypothetical protein